MIDDIVPLELIVGNAIKWSVPGVENAIFQKHLDKVKVGNELAEGCITSKIDTIKISEIVTILEEEEVQSKMEKLYIKEK